MAEHKALTASGNGVQIKFYGQQGQRTLNAHSDGRNGPSSWRMIIKTGRTRKCIYNGRISWSVEYMKIVKQLLLLLLQMSGLGKHTLVFQLCQFGQQFYKLITIIYTQQWVQQIIINSVKLSTCTTRTTITATISCIWVLSRQFSPAVLCCLALPWFSM